MSVNDKTENRGTHGVSSSMLDTLVSSSENPLSLDMGSVKKIADYFGVSTDYLLGRDENAPPGSAGAAHSSYWIFISLEFLPYLPRRRSTSSRPMRETALPCRSDTISAWRQRSTRRARRRFPAHIPVSRTGRRQAPPSTSDSRGELQSLQARYPAHEEAGRCCFPSFSPP